MVTSRQLHRTGELTPLIHHHAINPDRIRGIGLIAGPAERHLHQVFINRVAHGSLELQRGSHCILLRRAQENIADDDVVLIIAVNHRLNLLNIIRTPVVAGEVERHLAEVRARQVDVDLRQVTARDADIAGKLRVRAIGAGGVRTEGAVHPGAVGNLHVAAFKNNPAAINLRSTKHHASRAIICIEANLSIIEAAASRHDQRGTAINVHIIGHDNTLTHGQGLSGSRPQRQLVNHHVREPFRQHRLQHRLVNGHILTDFTQLNAQYEIIPIKGVAASGQGGIIHGLQASRAAIPGRELNHQRLLCSKDEIFTGDGPLTPDMNRHLEARTISNDGRLTIKADRPQRHIIPVRCGNDIVALKHHHAATARPESTLHGQVNTCIHRQAGSLLDKNGIPGVVPGNDILAKSGAKVNKLNISGNGVHAAGAAHVHVPDSDLKGDVGAPISTSQHGGDERFRAPRPVAQANAAIFAKMDGAGDARCRGNTQRLPGEAHATHRQRHAITKEQSGLNQGILLTEVDNVDIVRDIIIIVALEGLPCEFRSNLNGGHTSAVISHQLLKRPGERAVCPGRGVDDGINRPCHGEGFTLQHELVARGIGGREAVAVVAVCNLDGATEVGAAVDNFTINTQHVVDALFLAVPAEGGRGRILALAGDRDGVEGGHGSRGIHREGLTRNGDTVACGIRRNEFVGVSTIRKRQRRGGSRALVERLTVHQQFILGRLVTAPAEGHIGITGSVRRGDNRRLVENHLRSRGIADDAAFPDGGITRHIRCRDLVLALTIDSGELVLGIAARIDNLAIHLNLKGCRFVTAPTEFDERCTRRLHESLRLLKTQPGGKIIQNTLSGGCHGYHTKTVAFSITREGNAGGAFGERAHQFHDNNIMVGSTFNGERSLARIQITETITIGKGIAVEDIRQPGHIQVGQSAVICANREVEVVLRRRQVTQIQREGRIQGIRCGILRDFFRRQVQLGNLTQFRQSGIVGPRRCRSVLPVATVHRCVLSLSAAHVDGNLAIIRAIHRFNKPVEVVRNLPLQPGGRLGENGVDGDRGCIVTGNHGLDSLQVLRTPVVAGKVAGRSGFNRDVRKRDIAARYRHIRPTAERNRSTDQTVGDAHGASHGQRICRGDGGILNGSRRRYRTDVPLGDEQVTVGGVALGGKGRGTQVDVAAHRGAKINLELALATDHDIPLIIDGGTTVHRHGTGRNGEISRIGNGRVVLDGHRGTRDNDVSTVVDERRSLRLPVTAEVNRTRLQHQITIKRDFAVDMQGAARTLERQIACTINKGAKRRFFNDNGRITMNRQGTFFQDGRPGKIKRATVQGDVSRQVTTRYADGAAVGADRPRTRNTLHGDVGANNEVDRAGHAEGGVQGNGRAGSLQLHIARDGVGVGVKAHAAQAFIKADDRNILPRIGIGLCNGPGEGALHRGICRSAGDGIDLRDRGFGLPGSDCEHIVNDDMLGVIAADHGRDGADIRGTPVVTGEVVNHIRAAAVVLQHNVHLREVAVGNVYGNAGTHTGVGPRVRTGIHRTHQAQLALPPTVTEAHRTALVFNVGAVKVNPIHHQTPHAAGGGVILHSDERSIPEGIRQRRACLHSEGAIRQPQLRDVKHHSGAHRDARAVVNRDVMEVQSRKTFGNNG